LVELSTGRTRVVEDDGSSLGYCTWDPTILIKRHTGAQREREELDTWVHECLHRSMSKASEALVTRVAGDVSTVLWKAGYRRKRRRV
jgi:hypothetical protein